MDQLSDKLLLDTYYAAVDYKLDTEFIKMILAEMERRGMKLNDQKHTA